MAKLGCKPNTAIPQLPLTQLHTITLLFLAVINPNSRGHSCWTEVLQAKIYSDIHP
uniref:Uncharacterized protein n=1 Tax=Arundo donax TaxID=35708 RepID=A0A0A9A865_ARUDO